MLSIVKTMRSIVNSMENVPSFIKYRETKEVLGLQQNQHECLLEFGFLTTILNVLMEDIGFPASFGVMIAP